MTHVALPGGALNHGSCVGGAGLGCTPATHPSSVSNSSHVAVSPDGESIYTTAPSEDTIAHLRHGQGGELISTNCVSDNGQDGCDDPPIDSLEQVTSVAVSPDAESVYAVSGSFDNAITHFSRAGAGSACAEAEEKLDKDKLKKLQRQGASKKAIKKAKKKVKSAKEAVEEACGP